MRGHGTKSPFAWSAAAVALMALPGCDAGGISDPQSETPAADRVAYVGQEGGRAALFVQDADGGSRMRIRFTGAQEMPGNPDVVPPVLDENVLALGPLSWSPDGRRLAVVVTLAYDQSEIVVVNADGTAARVASLNTQIIMTGVDWSPDGTRLAYGMSTLPGAGGVLLFETDLSANTWRQVTKDTPVGSAPVDVRWNGDGTALYFWQNVGQTPSPSSEWIARVSQLEAATGAVRVVADSVVGSIQDVGRGGTWALVLRKVSRNEGEDWVRDLVRRPLIGLGPELKLAEGNLLWARASADDRAATLLSDGDPSQGTSRLTTYVLPIGGGKAAPIAGLDDGVAVLDVLMK